MKLEKILLIDDETDIRRIADLCLRLVGNYEVITAGSGEEGLYLSESEAPDLILLDVMMPGMDGTAVFEKLRANESTKNIPVIFMTARVQAREKQNYLSLGARGVIDKPFDPMTLPRQVRALFDEIDSHNLPESDSGQNVRDAARRAFYSPAAV
jgi:CheY-like chemotaxis protein